MTPETVLANKIKIECGKRGWLIIRQQSGNFYTKSGIPITIGFSGLSDYLILTNDGRAIFIETKIHPRKPTADQIRFIQTVRKMGFQAEVIYSLEEFLEKII